MHTMHYKERVSRESLESMASLGSASVGPWEKKATSFMLTFMQETNSVHQGHTEIFDYKIEIISFPEYFS